MLLINDMVIQEVLSSHVYASLTPKDTANILYTFVSDDVNEANSNGRTIEMSHIVDVVHEHITAIRHGALDATILDLSKVADNVSYAIRGLDTPIKFHDDTIIFDNDIYQKLLLGDNIPVSNLYANMKSLREFGMYPAIIIPFDMKLMSAFYKGRNMITIVARTTGGFGDKVLLLTIDLTIAVEELGITQQQKDTPTYVPVYYDSNVQEMLVQSHAVTADTFVI